MCTLTFIPGLPGGGFLLATNRDESPQRGPADPPSVLSIGKREVLAPRDSDQGGTWIGVDASGHCIAILNGDRPLPPGMLAVEEGTLVSRGRLVHDLLEDPRFNSVRDELQRRHRLDALHYKPFKLVVVSPGPSHGDGRVAHILRADWDGSYLRFEEEKGPRCAISSSFDTLAVTNYRRAAFERFVNEHQGAIRDGGSTPVPVEKLTEDLARFHASHHPEAPQGDARSVCMHREDARTVSNTLVLVTAVEVSMHYRAGWPCQAGAAQVQTLKRAE